jgi:hypothetical protein
MVGTQSKKYFNLSHLLLLQKIKCLGYTKKRHMQKAMSILSPEVQIIRKQAIISKTIQHVHVINLKSMVSRDRPCDLLPINKL